MEWIGVIGTALSLVMMIFKEIFSASARAREEDKKYQLDKEEFLKAADLALQKMRKQLVEDSQGAGSIDDKMDQDLKR